MNSNHCPILSICIGTYNRKKLLMELIQLILAYKEPEIEVIICDNASTDGTWEMICQIEDNRLHCYRNKENYGSSYNYLKSRLLGTGKYIMPLNDRALINMDEIKKVINKMKAIEADAIVASGHVQSEQMNIRSYEERVCLFQKLGEPGDVIFSGRIIQEYKNKYGSELRAENVSMCQGEFMHMVYQSNNWYWYERRLVVERPANVMKDIKVERKNNGYIFTGCPQGQIGIVTDRIRSVSYIEEQYKEEYCRGVIKAYARTLFWTVWRSKKNPELCQRYNYVSPKYIFWLKEMLIWKNKVKKCLKEQNCFNKEINRVIICRLWKEYFEFLYFRFCISEVVKAAVKIKHKCLGVPTNN